MVPQDTGAPTRTTETRFLRVFGEKEKCFHSKVSPHILVAVDGTLELILDQNNKIGEFNYFNVGWFILKNVMKIYGLGCGLR